MNDSIFSDIEVPILQSPLTKEDIDKYVRPFYMNIYQIKDDFVEPYLGIHNDITPSLITKLLSDFNWRPRLAAAYFVAINRLSENIEHIGKLLLRSDVCYAGKGYCIALAQLNLPVCLDYLKRYLDYYLTRPDLYYDQREAMAALSYLDAKNGTSTVSSYMDLWNSFSGNSSTDYEIDCDFSGMMKKIDMIHDLASGR